MSDFKAKMHQIQFRLGLRSAPDPAGFSGGQQRGGIEKGRVSGKVGGGEDRKRAGIRKGRGMVRAGGKSRRKGRREKKNRGW